MPHWLEARSDRKVTLGIMESWRARVHIDPVHCFSAVGSALPGRAAKPFFTEVTTFSKKALGKKYAKKERLCKRPRVGVFTH
ncbi:MAG: hypothetical protein DRP18_02545 [Candidatus Aenigmatarchaeota archaeon]|nr:MAG: hypothetical protein DRP18_02545 [Candidatus Aenigmarchaeota archaeon]RLJ08220.1 MAG: hypothetical protein DRP16_01880 [Candidatus Aenigmarchaeota archaeon]